LDTLNEIFKPKDKKSKDQVMYEAHLQYGYTLKEIAEYIGVHYSTVSRAIKKIEGEDKSDITRPDPITKQPRSSFRKKREHSLNNLTLISKRW
jgi:DNA-binding MarR family transcriptional regulator